MLEICSLPIHWQIQDFPGGGAPTLKVGVLIYYFAFFPEICIEMKEFGSWGVSLSPLDPPKATTTGKSPRLFHTRSTAQGLHILKCCI